MKAMILETYGPEATFVAAERDIPTAEAGEVLVKVAATSVNTVDTMIRQLGQEQLPLSPGLRYCAFSASASHVSMAASMPLPPWPFQRITPSWSMT